VAHLGADARSALDGPGGSVEGSQDAVAGGLDVVAAPTLDLGVDNGVVTVEERPPV
jgi:hypothetical protein